MTEYQLIEKNGELQRQIKQLLEENAQLRFERDIARADLSVLLVATPEQEEAYRQDVERAVEFDIDGFLVELETEDRSHGI